MVLNQSWNLQLGIGGIWNFGQLAIFAIGGYTAALVKDPKDINVRTDLGLTFLVREPPDLNRAVQEFRRSLQIDPRHEQTLQNMTIALLKKGSYAEADATLKKLAEVNPNNQSLAQLRSDLEASRGKTMQPASK